MYIMQYNTFTGCYDNSLEPEVNDRFFHTYIEWLCFLVALDAQLQYEGEKEPSRWYYLLSIWQFAAWRAQEAGQFNVGVSKEDIRAYHQYMIGHFLLASVELVDGVLNDFICRIPSFFIASGQ